MSIRNIRKLKISNENKDEIQGILDKNPLFKRILECMVYLENNPLTYYDGLEDLNYYEIYKLIQHKIRDVVSPFLDTHISIEAHEDLYYELRFSEGFTPNSNLISEAASWVGETPEFFLQRVKREKEENMSVRPRFEILFINGDDRFKNLFEILMDNIKDSINKFLTNFHHRHKDQIDQMRSRGIHVENLHLETSYIADDVGIILHIPFCIFEMESLNSFRKR